MKPFDAERVLLANTVYDADDHADRIKRWRDEGTITQNQYETLSNMIYKKGDK